ncbi:restriction endonuclease subunit S [Polaribacter pectinis]|uniref:Restriction endonuclease subunit S n=1 Tax=Polaribacter pectinis TaxID=2738844 RepID=A0A7G9LCN1_9FLAO|nr:restriction endonuclease subunit S [Polaribacter pectinis]QNM86380.1 restriction endonuclease subunit S [Polaribacter pectinis]
MSSIDDKLPDGWIETTLAEIVISANTGLDAIKRAPIVEQETGIKCFRIQDASQKKKYENWGNTKVEEKNYKRFQLLTGDILIARTGNTIGVNYLVSENLKSVFNNGLIRLRVNEKCDYKFLYKIIESKLFDRYVQSIAYGTSTQPNMQINVLLGFELNIPPLEEQKAIAKVLTAFDDKIENLRAQNQTLEQTAQTIFKEWFGKYQIGDELPEGWKIGTIGNLTEIKRGGSPRPIKDYISDSGYRWLKISDATATDSPFIFEIKEHIKIEGLKKTTLKKAGDLVLSNSATPGMPKFLAVDTCVHDGWMHFPSSIVSNEYLYLLFLHIRPTLVQQGSGSVFVNLKTDILRFYETVIPSNKALTDFDKLIKPIFDKILSNSKQIQTLTKTRDALLPKLMRGEIRVNGFKK